MNPKRLMVNVLACAALVGAVAIHRRGAASAAATSAHSLWSAAATTNRSIRFMRVGAGIRVVWGLSDYPPYGGYWYGPSYASIRVQVTPKKAEVYLDGYYVGVVDDFDGDVPATRRADGPARTAGLPTGLQDDEREDALQARADLQGPGGPAAARAPATRRSLVRLRRRARSGTRLRRAASTRRLKVRIRRRARRDARRHRTLEAGNRRPTRSSERSSFASSPRTLSS